MIDSANDMLNIARTERCKGMGGSRPREGYCRGRRSVRRSDATAFWRGAWRLSKRGGGASYGKFGGVDTSRVERVRMMEGRGKERPLEMEWTVKVRRARGKCIKFEVFNTFELHPFDACVPEEI